jgi:hypothetical protein
VDTTGGREPGTKEGMIESGMPIAFDLKVLDMNLGLARLCGLCVLLPVPFNISRSLHSIVLLGYPLTTWGS